jgi:DNA transposition AAA+ family ATPase
MCEDSTPGLIRPDGGTAFDQFGMEARMEARMLDADKPVTDEQRQALIRELQTYRDNHKTGRGKPMPWEQLGAKIGVSGSSLVEIVRGNYKADPSNALRKVDQFLADERVRLGRFDARSFARIDLTGKIKGAIEQGLKHNTIPVIIGEPGSGKSAHARWFVGQREGAILIEPDEVDCDRKWAIDAIYKAFGIFGRNHRF